MSTLEFTVDNVDYKWNSRSGVLRMAYWVVTFSFRGTYWKRKKTSIRKKNGVWKDSSGIKWSVPSILEVRLRQAGNKNA